MFHFSHTKEKTPYNVVLVVADALSAGHTSLHGYERDTTPFLNDFFTQRGVIYKQARSSASWTLPSFASFMRSQLSSQVETGRLLRDPNSLPALLRQHDIELVAFLKDFYKPISTLQSIATLYRPDEFTTSHYHEHESSITEAAAWLAAYSKRSQTEQCPFFLFLHNTCPHNPYDDAPAEFRSYFGQGDTSGPITNKPYLESLDETVAPTEKDRIELLYDQEVRYLDSLMEKLLQSIPPTLLRNTIVIFTADHGDEFGNHKGQFNHGWSLYDELIHVPLAVYHPDWQPGMVTTGVSLLDLVPTIANNFNVSIPQQCVGTLLPETNDEQLAERVLTAEGNFTSFNNQSDLFDFKDSIYELPVTTTTTHLAFFKKGWKLIVTNHEEFELYQVHEDVMEANNLYLNRQSLPQSDKETVAELLQHYESYKREQAARLGSNEVPKRQR